MMSNTELPPRGGPLVGSSEPDAAPPESSSVPPRDRPPRPPLPIPQLAWPPHVSPMHKKAIAYLVDCLKWAADDGDAERMDLIAQHAPTLRSWSRKGFVDVLKGCGFYARKIRSALEYMDSQGQAVDDAPVPETEVYVIRRKVQPNK